MSDCDKWWSEYAKSNGLFNGSLLMHHFSFFSDEFILPIASRPHYPFCFNLCLPLVVLLLSSIKYHAYTTFRFGTYTQEEASYLKRLMLYFKMLVGNRNANAAPLFVVITTNSIHLPLIRSKMRRGDHTIWGDLVFHAKYSQYTLYERC